MRDLKRVIYLDHNATTPLDLQVFDAMKPYFLDKFGNASSTDHRHGSEASAAVESARGDVARAIGAKTDEIIFTSGATESDNLAIRGIAEKYKDRGDHIITCVTEHEAVLETVKYLESIGKHVTYISVDELGRIDIGELESAITDKTVMISVMAANNEIGVIPDIKKIGEIAHNKNIFFHTDAAQAVGNIPIDVNDMNIDLMSFSAHKMYGPKGVGALYIRELSSMMLDTLQEEGALLNGDWNNRLAGNINVCYPEIEGKAIINSVSESLAISAGSACTTHSVEPSHVIMALGYGEQHAHSSIRIGLGRYTNRDDAEFGAQTIVDAVRAISKING